MTRFHPSIVHIPSKLVHTVVGSSCLRVKRTKHRRYSCCVWHGTQRLTKVSCTALCRCLTEYLLTFNIHPVLSLPTHDIHLYSQCVLTLIIFQHPVLLHLCMSISSCDIYFLTRLWLTLLRVVEKVSVSPNLSLICGVELFIVIFLSFLPLSSLPPLSFVSSLHHLLLKNYNKF